MSPLDHSPLFLRSGRFEPLRQLGSGGFGVVYEVFDQELDRNVALKVLHRADPESLLSFKAEFRQLCDIQHPNLVRLHELFVDDSRWFFTMDLVHGLPLLHELSAEQPQPVTDETGTVSVARAPRGVEEPRLRELFAALARGVDALHRRGKLHRDLKPSNALVDHEGHVVLVDFGLVQDIATGGERGSIVGTPLYMSPEQLGGRTLLPASDWYSYGVMLYLALTGRHPFSGGAAAMAANGIEMAPVPVERWSADAPRDLAAIAIGLLSLNADERPDYTEIARTLDERAVRQASPTSSQRKRFVGRAAERAAILDAFRETRPARPVVVHIQGASGNGKSALVEEALAEIQDLFPETVALSGRCFEHELVPFKAFDALVDSLSQWLAQLPLVEQHTYLPRRLDALVSLFPALARVAAVRDTPRAGESAAGAARRLIAARALRELIGRIADRRPLVLIIDDVQWSDDDSARLLSELVGGEAPGVMWVLCARDDTWRSQGPLADPERDGRLLLTRLTLGPLDKASAETLALELVGDDERRAHEIAALADGNPFFLERLALWTGAAGDDLNALIRARLDSLPAAQRALIDTVAVAGRPLPLEVVLAAADGDDDGGRTWAALVDDGMLRVLASPGGRSAQAAHDRIREEALRALTEDRRTRLHAALAQALLALPDPPSDQVARHMLASGNATEGILWTARAAADAMKSFAFERAVELYELLLEEAADHDDRTSWRAAFAEALARAGRGAEAAAVFLTAADETAAPDRALALRQQAAEQLLVSGRYDEGIALAASALGEGGIRVFRSTSGAVASLALQQVAILMRGRRFTPRPADECDPRALRQIDLCWSMALGLMMIEPIQCGDFAARHMRLALKTGEPSRVARGYVMDATFSAALGRGMKSSGRIWGEAIAAMGERDDPYLRGLVPLLRSLSAAGETDWHLALRLGDEAGNHFRERVPGASTEIVWSEIVSQKSLSSLAEYAEKERRLHEIVRSAEERGDHLSASIHGIDSQPMALLGEDRLEDARRVLEDSVARWTPAGFQVPHYAAQQMAARLLLYEGRGVEAWRTNRRIWSRLTTTFLMRVPFFGLEAAHLNGTAAVMAARQLPAGADRRAALKDAERYAARARRLGLTSSMGISHLLWAGIERVREQPGAARYHLEMGIRELELCGLSVPAAMAEHALGELLTGSEGAERKARAAEATRRAGIANLGAMMRLWVPGFGDAAG